MDENQQKPLENPQQPSQMVSPTYSAPAESSVTPVSNPVSPIGQTTLANAPYSESEPQIEPHSLRKNRAIVIAGALYLFNVCALAAAYISSEYEVAHTLTTVTLCTGILAALLLGIGMMQTTLYSMQHGAVMNNRIKFGIILLIASIIGGIFTLIPGLILITIGLKEAPLPNAAPITGTKKIMFAVLTFIGGGLSGLLVSGIIYFMISDRACQLSSSKCY
ncbi:MAG: hypothetical protein QFB86_02200 [Patescibacteria group bacterium]|nr:hypothetical protein [Patescibacteria group bacterium]